MDSQLPSTNPNVPFSSPNRLYTIITKLKPDEDTLGISAARALPSIENTQELPSIAMEKPLMASKGLDIEGPLPPIGNSVNSGSLSRGFEISEESLPPIAQGQERGLDGIGGTVKSRISARALISNFNFVVQNFGHFFQVFR